MPGGYWHQISENKGLFSDFLFLFFGIANKIFWEILADFEGGANKLSWQIRGGV